jgi:hypothetical protein
MKLKSSLLPILGLLCLPWTAGAHYLWIESSTPDQARVYFGEVAEGVREKAGGRLDERDAIQARLEQVSKAARPLTLTKKEDHFSLTNQDHAGWLIVQDLAGKVQDWSKSDIGIVKPMFYGRAAVAGKVSATKPTLTLDILPDPSNPHELQVFFNQQPLPKAKVLIYAPNQWMQEFQTDEAGKVKISTPWPGLYVLDVIYKERTPGEFEGTKYEAIRHRATFSHKY